MKFKFKKKIKKIIIKVGTNVLTNNSGLINLSRIKQLVKDIVFLKESGYEVILVSSGAICAGFGKIKTKTFPSTLSKKQAFASIGQVILMKLYENLFSKHNKIIGQILLTREDFINRKQNLNAKNTLYALLKMNVIPIINENDTIAVDEIKLGDNDKLAALVASLVDGDLLILLSDINGFYTSNPKIKLNAKLYKIIDKITPEIEIAAGKKGSIFGTGGMITKIQAAKIAIDAGIYMIIGNGRKKNLLQDIVNGSFEGTIFIPKNTSMLAKKKWLLLSSKPLGSIVIDEGAVEALSKKGKSLLAIGINSVIGNFNKNSVVSILNKEGTEIGRGISYYNSKIIDQVKGFTSKEMLNFLKKDYIYDTIINRDNLSIRKE